MSLLALAMIAKCPVSSAILDVAPTQVLSDVIRESQGGSYISMDFDPQADGRLVDFRADITRLPLRADSVGFLLCSHVLEHVIDDNAAISEIMRVLKDGAATLIQVPRRRGVPTQEAPGASPDERLNLFGQADHVRLYGDDFEDRLRNAGLRVETMSYAQVLPRLLLDLIGVFADHELWIATTGAEPKEFLDHDAVLTVLARRLMSSSPGSTAEVTTTRILDLEDQLAIARDETETWRSRYEWLHGRPPIKAASAVKRSMTRIITRLTPRGRTRERP